MAYIYCKRNHKSHCWVCCVADQGGKWEQQWLHTLISGGRAQQALFATGGKGGAKTNPGLAWQVLLCKDAQAGETGIFGKLSTSLLPRAGFSYIWTVLSRSILTYKSSLAGFLSMLSVMPC